MKTLSIFRAGFLLFLSLSFQIVFASGGGTIQGQVTDSETKEPVDGATVLLECQGGTYNYKTNVSGYFYASNIPPGVYTVTVSFMNNKQTVTDVKVGNGEVKELSIEISTVYELPDISVLQPVVDMKIYDGRLHPREEFKNGPFQNVPDLVKTEPAVVEIDGEFYVHGARAGSLSYYIDDCRVMGSPNIPLCGLDMYRSYTAYVPARYGDCTGGVIAMETRNYFGE